MMEVQVAGLLARDDIRARVLGRAVAAPGGVLDGLSDPELARLRYFHRAMTGQVADLAFSDAGPDLAPQIVLAIVDEITGLFGQADPMALFARRQAISVRAASRLRGGAGPTTLRKTALSGDVVTASLRQPYAKFFAMEEYDVAWRRFDGTMTPPATRAAFVSGDAVTVLPYDPQRDRVLLVEQFRAGPHARGDTQPWQLEAIAGRIDPGETPEQAARREAVEEAGLALGPLLPVAGYYPSPGILTEYLYSYVAITDLPDGAAGVFGLEAEQEDIRGHLISFDRLMGLVASGEIANAPLILTALWLARERPELRG